MRIFISTVSALALVAAGNIALAHGPGGGTSTYKSESPAIKFNVAPSHHAPVNYQTPPGMEMSVEGQTIILKITDAEGKPMDTELADAKTFVIAGGEISTLHLWPAGGNTLSGKGDFTPETGMRVEVQLHLPDRETIRKEFYPLK